MQFCEDFSEIHGLKIADRKRRKKGRDRSKKKTWRRAGSNSELSLTKRDALMAISSDDNIVEMLWI
jgi:hypothetical protein